MRKIIFVLILSLLIIGVVSADTWLNGWQYRQKHDITGNFTWNTQYGYGMLFKIVQGMGVSSGDTIYIDPDHIQSDNEDLRFTLPNGTKLSYHDIGFYDGWVFVNFPEIYNTTNQVYVYYGNPFAVSESDGKSTYPLLYDDFNGGDLNVSLWTSSGSVNVDTNYVTVYRTGGVNAVLESISTFNDDKTVITVMRSGHFQNTTYGETFYWNCAIGHTGIYPSSPIVIAKKFWTYNGTYNYVGDITGWSASFFHLVRLTRNARNTVILTVDTNTPQISYSNIPTGLGKIVFSALTADESILTIDMIAVMPYIYPEPYHDSWYPEEERLFPTETGTPTPTPTPVETIAISPGNISVHSIGIDYIVWNFAENVTGILVDGVKTRIYGNTYGQYDLETDTKHCVCTSTSCLCSTTLTDGISVFEYWIVFIILVALCVVAYYIPISYVFQVIYGIYLIGNYLPSVNAPFEQYLLAGILMIFGMIAGIRGYTK